MDTWTKIRCQTVHSDWHLKQTLENWELPLDRTPEHINFYMRFLFLIIWSRKPETIAECIGSQEPGEFD